MATATERRQHELAKARREALTTALEQLIILHSPKQIDAQQAWELALDLEPIVQRLLDEAVR